MAAAAPVKGTTSQLRSLWTLVGCEIPPAGWELPKCGIQVPHHRVLRDYYYFWFQAEIVIVEDSEHTQCLAGASVVVEEDSAHW